MSNVLKQFNYSCIHFSQFLFFRWFPGWISTPGSDHFCKLIRNKQNFRVRSGNQYQHKDGEGFGTKSGGNQFWDFSILSTRQGHLWTNHTFTILLHWLQTKSKACLTHCYNVINQPSICLSMHSSICFGTSNTSFHSILWDLFKHSTR